MLGLGKDNAGSESSPGPDPDQEKAIEFTQQHWNDLKNAYTVYHQSVWEALLFYANQSWIELDGSKKMWQPIQTQDEYVPKPRINRFSPTVDAVCSNFFQIPEVDPNPEPEDDPTAMMVARVADDLVEYFFITTGLRAQIGQKMDKAGLAAQLFVLCGGVFTNVHMSKKDVGSSPQKESKPGVNVVCPNCDTMETHPDDGSAPQTCPKCGQPLRSQPTTMSVPSVGPDGQPVMTSQSEYEICCSVGNTLYAFPRPGSTDGESSPYLLWAERMPLDTIWFRYDNFEATADSVWPDGYSVTYEHALNFWYTGYSSSTMQTKDSCMVLQMYVAPGKVKDHPDGFYAVSINDKCAHYEKWDFPEHPITLGAYLTLPTIFFPRSVSFDLVEVQRELNNYESLIKLHAMTSASDPIIVDANTQVSEITGRADKVIKWRAITPTSKEPHRMASGHLDDGVYKQRDNLHAEFQNISMAVNAFRGEQEGAIVAASAVSQLRSQAEVMFSKPSANWANLWKETARKAVKFIQKYYTFPQLAAILGPGREAEIRAFQQANLDTALSYYASAHGTPRTREERKQEIMTMWDKKALDINQPEVRQKIYELFGETGMMKAFNRDATRARLENQAMKAGKKIVPMVGIEDLGVHYYVHADQIKSLDFDTWPQPAKQLLIEHTTETKQAMMQEQMQQAAIQKSAEEQGKSNAQIFGAQGATAAARKAPPRGPGQPAPPGAAPKPKGGAR